MFTRLARFSMYTVGAYLWAHMPHPMMHCISLDCGNYEEESSSITSFVMRNCRQDIYCIEINILFFTLSSC